MTVASFQVLSESHSQTTLQTSHKTTGTGSFEDNGRGKGENYCLNIPLKQGLNGQQFRHLFQSIVPTLVDAYKPDALVFVCGADGLAHDPLVGGKNQSLSQDGWNLDIHALGDVLSYSQSEFQLPMLVLGGGGYNHQNTARCLAYCTSKLLKEPIQLDKNIPEHDCYNLYAPDYELEIECAKMQDRNPFHDVELLIEASLDRIQRIKKVTMCLD